MKLETCRVLITGASGGIGQALVEQMCAAGAQVLAVSRDADRLAVLRARFPERLHHVAADLGSAAGLDAVAAAAQTFGGLNCVIQAAGINRFDLLEQSLESARVGIRSQEKSLAELLAHAADLERNGQKVPAAITDSIARTRDQVNEQRAYLERREKEHVALKAEYDRLLARYRELKAGAASTS